MKRPRLKSARRVTATIFKDRHEPRIETRPEIDPYEKAAQLDRIEQKIDVVIASAHPPIPKAATVPSHDPDAPIETITQKNIIHLFQAMRRRNKIHAIKEIRAILGIGLKEAKDLCEQHFFNPAPDSGVGIHSQDD